ncbi:unnamed protein product [Prorocentrum cordatum]|uniref:Uncharacterized protein n=1 Tax=Prorocentrum cordatum TaxID=2364126 RepID=A0ABN9QER2_9DINO|nr:unnamed protein product [Polarella glacialis]
MTSAAVAWGRCGGCGRCEYNSALVARDRRCACGRQSKLYVPKGNSDRDNRAKPLADATSKNGKSKGVGQSRGGGGSASQASAGQAASPSRAQLFEQTISTTSDPLLLKLLQDTVNKVKAASQPTQSPEEALRLASGAWRDGALRRDQAVHAVVKAQENLAKAQQREREAALTLARAEQARTLAAQGLASDMGIAAEEKEVLFQVKIDEEFFASLDSLDIEQQDREALQKLEQELRNAQVTMEGKHSEVQQWQARMAEPRQKANVAEPAAAPPPAGSGASSAAAAAAAPPTAGAAGGGSGLTEEAKLQRAAERLSESKLAAAMAAQAAKVAAAAASGASAAQAAAQTDVPE